MKSVNVRQLKNNPSDALRMARKAPVVVMNCDQPEAMLFHLSDDGLLGEPGVRLALATSLYREESVCSGAARRSPACRWRSSCCTFRVKAYPLFAATSRAYAKTPGAMSRG